MFTDELERAQVGLRNFPRVAVTEPVFGSREGEELVFHTVPGQLTGHVDGAGVGNISIFGAVNHQNRRIVVRDLFHRAESIEPTRLLRRVDAGHSDRPTAGFSQVAIVAAPCFSFGGIVRVCQDAFSDGRQRLVARYGDSVMRGFRPSPFAVDVAVTPIGQPCEGVDLLISSGE